MATNEDIDVGYPYVHRGQFRARRALRANRAGAGSNVKKWSIADDLDQVLARTEPMWRDLKGQRLFVTGGTGFFGRWLLESFAWANARLNLDARALVLSRDAAAFNRAAPHLASVPAIQYCAGDVRDFEFPPGGFSHIVHAAATSAVATFNNEDPVTKFDTVALGTRHTLEFALRCGARKFLMTSSGSVYGRGRSGCERLSEDSDAAPDPALPEAAALGEGKRAAEFFCAAYARKFGIETKIARCFSFVGPFLQMDIHYAVGNFIADAVRGRAIHVNGDGTPIRSYLYASDLMVWLWTLLFRGGAGCVYNVGSEEEISIAGLARLIARCAGSGIDVRFAAQADDGPAAERYVPDTRRIREDLMLTQTVSLQQAIEKTASWYRESIRDGSKARH